MSQLKSSVLKPMRNKTIALVDKIITLGCPMANPRWRSMIRHMVQDELEAAGSEGYDAGFIMGQRWVAVLSPTDIPD